MEAIKNNYEEEIKKCKSIEELLGENGIIKRIVKELIEDMLEVEIEEYIGRKRYSGDESIHN